MKSETTTSYKSAIVVLAVITAVIHFYLAFFVMKPSPDLVFLLNGLGYLGLTAALYLPLAFLAPWSGSVRWVLIGYTALTVILWAAIGSRNVLAYVDKLVEVAMIVLLWLETQRK